VPFTHALVGKQVKQIKLFLESHGVAPVRVGISWKNLSVTATM
jgi:hypothetical protein